MFSVADRIVRLRDSGPVRERDPAAASRRKTRELRHGTRATRARSAGVDERRRPHPAFRPPLPALHAATTKSVAPRKRFAQTRLISEEN
jgi:hypothetical protein